MGSDLLVDGIPDFIDLVEHAVEVNDPCLVLGLSQLERLQILQVEVTLVDCDCLYTGESLPDCLIGGTIFFQQCQPASAIEVDERDDLTGCGFEDHGSGCWGLGLAGIGLSEVEVDGTPRRLQAILVSTGPACSVELGTEILQIDLVQRTTSADPVSVCRSL